MDDLSELDKKSLGKRSGFIIPFSLGPVFNAMTMEDRGWLITAIYAYVINGEMINIDKKPLVKVGMDMFIEQYANRTEEYLAKCRKNRENGKKSHSNK